MARKDLRVAVQAKVYDEEGGIHDVEIDLPVGGFFTKFEVDGSRTRVVHCDFGYGSSESFTIKMPPIASKTSGE